ncbi:MAG TPA: ImmA/IrrE family metallo-endopeptidase [Candidatus Paceibacterota bacterium]|nr:ImmA/IrrE family metallo-endopeptidase [Candidatus Paceibacterota bacterium]
MMSERIEKKAEEVLSALNVKSIPISVEEIANQLKIKIGRAPSSEFSGMLIRKDGRALMGINNSEGTARQRFTIAHELGHYFLHPQNDTFVDYRQNEKEPRNHREREADMFAAALLMPRKEVTKDFQKIVRKGFSEIELHKLAGKYEVSDKAMRFRLVNLNMLLG